MNVRRARWKVRLTAAAQDDFRDIVRWTSDMFGPAQVQRYREVIFAAIDALEAGPDLPDSKTPLDSRQDLRTLHVARGGRRGRHLLLYRSRQVGSIDVLRILHESMHLPRHVPDEDDEP